MKMRLLDWILIFVFSVGILFNSLYIYELTKRIERVDHYFEVSMTDRMVDVLVEIAEKHGMGPVTPETREKIFNYWLESNRKAMRELE